MSVTVGPGRMIQEVLAVISPPKAAPFVEHNLWPRPKLIDIDTRAL